MGGTLSVTPAPPAAKRIPVTVERHGQSFTDDYGWLRGRENPAVLEYLESENHYTAAMTADLQPQAEAIYQEMLGRIQQTDLSVPVRRGEYFYYSRTVEGLQYPIHCRKRGNLEAAEEILLDMNQLAAGLEFLSLGSFDVSDDARRLAYTTDNTGMRRYTLHLKNLETGETQAGLAERVTSVEWAADNQTLFYTTEEPVTKRSDRLFRMRLDAGAVQEIYHEPDALYQIGVQRTRDREYLLLAIGATDSTEFHYWRAAEHENQPRLFLKRERDHKYDLDHRQGLFYIRSNRGAKNFRLLTTPVGQPEAEHWQERIAHDPAVLLEGVELFRDHAVLVEKHEGLDRLRVLEFATGAVRPIAAPEAVYTMFPGGNPEFETTQFRYQYESPVTPASVFEHDLATGANRLLKQQAVLGGYDPTRYECARLWVTARDGTRVPLSAVYPKGFPRDGSGAVLLYGYGSYGYGLPATFSSARLSLLDRGMAYVIAHVRGGNELGEAWHDAGMLMQKKNTFFDFVDAAEYLIREKWTRPERLAIEGGSAGGLLIGAVLNLRPDLFGAAHLAVPFVDVINTMCDETLPLTTGEYLEWGDPREAQAFAYMLSYSPYDNLQAAEYPPMLVTTSLHDSQVMYWEPAKYVAKLRRLKTNDTPLLLKTNLAAGHGGASGRYDRLREIAFEYAWLMREAGDV
ncbi:MAG TPA: S9 family peptidase [Terriglobales bacterium]|nr:S9 family peptidase [Terriglobales bacterium]